MRSATRCRRWPATTWPPIPPCSRRWSGRRRRLGRRRTARARAAGRARGHPGTGPAGQRAPAGAAQPRPVRQPDRRGRVPPRLARPDGDRGRPRAARGAVGGPAARRPRGQGREVLRMVPGGGGPRLSHLDDLRGGAGAAARAGAGRPVRAAARHPCLRPRPAPARRQARPAVRHGHDREAGRQRRAGEHHPRRARPRRRRRRARADRAQVVLLRADVGSVPHPRPGPGRAHLLPAPPRAARR